MTSRNICLVSPGIRPASSQSSLRFGSRFAIDTAEKVVVRKQLRRSQVVEFFKALPACLVGMEACATAHYSARELTKLGHQVRLMPAKDVKAYVNPSNDTLRAIFPWQLPRLLSAPRSYEASYWKEPSQSHCADA
jgi:hypothetical protein